MSKKRDYLIGMLLLISAFACIPTCNELNAEEIEPGSYRLTKYLPRITDKKVGLVINHASVVGAKHLLDTLLSRGVDVKKVFTPEHGFRGNHDAGAAVDDGESAGNIPIISLYGAKKKPKSEDLKGLDVILFDLQDVGVRFYTYISTLHYVMEACAENDVPIIVLDRPNPNAHYIDGPVLDEKFKSFVGMHPVPVVYGMSIGEYAMMINGEGWLADAAKCDLEVIPIANWTHQSVYDLPIKPSPNLPNLRSIYLYPSMAFFEGTIVSEGRGTTAPFQQYGHPQMTSDGHSFKPVRTPGASLNPKHKGVVCNGYDLSTLDLDSLKIKKTIELEYLIGAYAQLKQHEDFFNNFFNLLAGTDQLQKDIKNDLDQEAIRKRWEAGIENFKSIRVKYLIYPN